MFMNKENIRGWKDVYRFTLSQTLKGKAYRISFVIFILLSMLSMPLLGFITRDKDSAVVNKITKVYVQNNTQLQDFTLTKPLQKEGYENIVFEPIKDSYEKVETQVEEKERTAVILTISSTGQSYNFQFLKASKGSVSKENVQELSDLVLAQFEDYCIQTLSVSKEQLDMLHAQVITNNNKVDENGQLVVKEDTSISSSQYFIIYGILMFILLTTSFSGAQVATSILTEKANKLVEYLMTSVKPLALMIGKILAMLTCVVLQVITLIVIMFVSNQVTSKYMMDGENVLSKVLDADILKNINIGNGILCLILIALGLIFYASLAGLAGATVSKMEEANEGMTLFTLANMVGAYIGIAAASVMVSSGFNGFVIFACIFPLSSPFVLPGTIIIGKVSLGFSVLAILLEILVIYLLFGFISKVYEILILHNGNKVKLKELFGMAKSNRRVSNEEK